MATYPKKTWCWRRPLHWPKTGLTMNPTTEATPELLAPANWQVVEFISDLHLQAQEPLTLRAWEQYMATTEADAVFILGDLFEVWVGDDVLTLPAQTSGTAENFEAHCCQTLRAAADKRDVFFIHGNRDFLLGKVFAQTCGLTLLADPTVLVFGGERWLLSHGDAMCLDDADYLQFRAQVRTASWQHNFLAKPLSERQAIALAMRQQSELRKRSGMNYVDVDNGAARQALQAASARTLIHGHTHQPADHELGDGLRRLVLSDWDAAAQPSRVQVMRLSTNPSHTGLVQMQRRVG
jgi:UDP-2,3-diacylglucosamine hydrolase